MFLDAFFPLHHSLYVIHNTVLIKENLKKELSKPIQTDQDDLIVVSQKALTHLISSCGINVHHESQIRALHITYIYQYI